MADKNQGRRGMTARQFAQRVASAAAIGFGTNYALRLVDKKWKKRRSGSKTVTRKRYRKKVASNFRSGMPSVTLTKRKKTYKENHSTENRATSLQVPAKRSSPMGYINCILEPHWYRAQGLSQYDTSVGFYSICNRTDGVGNVILPCHVWDLTACQNYDGSVTQIPDVGYQLGFNSTADSADTVTFSLPGQSANGVTTPVQSRLIAENVTGSTVNTFPNRKGYHHWTHIKMNLYGVRKRSTRFKVEMIMVKDSFSDFISAASTNTEKKRLYSYLAKPFVYSNLNSGDPQTKADFKILKSYEVIVPASKLDDYGGENAVPNIQTLNWFINHNRLRRYDWQKGNPDDHAQDAGFDTEGASGISTRVDPRYRIYLLVRALSPERRSIIGGTNETPADPISEPSYDFVMRQKFSFPT